MLPAGLVMKEWMKRICPCFIPYRIALTESSEETVSLPRLRYTLSTRFFMCLEPWSKDCTTGWDAYEIVDVSRTDTKQDVVAQQNL